MELWIWVALMAGSLAGIFYIVWLVGRLSRARIPGAIGWFDCSFEEAHVEADNVLNRVWRIPVVFENRTRQLRQLRQMMSVATVISTPDATQRRARPYTCNGIFEWDLWGAEKILPAEVIFNPGTIVTGRILVELPPQVAPAKARLVTFVDGKPGTPCEGIVTARADASSPELT